MDNDAVTHGEIASITQDVQNLGKKIDVMGSDVNAIKVMLAEQRGANLNGRLSDVESRIRDLDKFKYKLVGGLILVNAVMVVLGKYLLSMFITASN